MINKLNKEIRIPKSDDQENVDKCISYIHDIYKNHPEIDPTLWSSVFWSCLVMGYKNCEFNYEDFSKEIENVKNHYKEWFEEESDAIFND